MDYKQQIGLGLAIVGLVALGYAQLGAFHSFAGYEEPLALGIKARYYATGGIILSVVGIFTWWKWR